MTNPRAPDLAAVAALIGQESRAAMMDALMGGRWLTATELARHARIAPATASEHLERLVDGGLVVRRRSGRYHYHALSGPEVAEVLENLGRVACATGHTDITRVPRPLRFARTCYDHVAGRLGVFLADELVHRGLVDPDGPRPTPRGTTWLARLGIDAAALENGRRPVLRYCLDWSERRHHLAGAAAAALADTLLERGWLVRIDGTRALRLTVRGQDGLYRLGLDLPADPDASQ